MNLSIRFINICRFCLPNPFTIAVILTFITALLAFTLTEPSSQSSSAHIMQIGQFWQAGFWDLLKFAMQMMLILVLGHSLAHAPVMIKLIEKLVKHCNSSGKAAVIVSIVTMLLGFINWGLGLIVGALFARSIADHAKANNIKINYPLIAACGYTCMLVWHGGLSGSATLKVAESNHFLIDKIGQVPLSETIFSPLNGFVTLLLLTIIPVVVYVIGKNSKGTDLSWLESEHNFNLNTNSEKPYGAEHLDNSRIIALGFGLSILGLAFYNIFIVPEKISINILSLDLINFILFGLGICLHGSIKNYIVAIDDAIAGASGIMVQFPIYAGIAGIMQYSGLIHVFSDFITTVSTQASYPLFTLLSSAVVNIFVPSGGGQWAVQGPILAEAAATLKVNYGVSIMAFAYGDQLTNMLQPFWALPLLGITKLKAHEILPYTILLMIIATGIFCAGLWFFGH